MANEERLTSIAPSALEDGELVPFHEQIERYALGELPSSEVLVVAGDSRQAGLPMLGGDPLIIDQETVRKVTGEHHLTLSDLRDLPRWFQEHPLAMDSLTVPEAIVVVADFQDRRGRHVIMPVHIHKEIGQDARRVTVDDIASIYGKRNLQYLIENTAKAEKTIYVNERTKGWELRTGLQLPLLTPNRFIDEYTLAPTSDLDHIAGPRAEAGTVDGRAGSESIAGTRRGARRGAPASEIEDAAIIHGFDRLEEHRKRRSGEHVEAPEADIVVVRKGEPGPDGVPVPEDMVFAVAGDDGSELGRDLLKTVAAEAEDIIDGTASTAPSVTAWISDYDLKELADLAERPANGELYDLLAGTRERSDEAVYDPLTERLFLGYAGRDEPTVNEYAGAGVSVGGMIEAAARAVAESPAPEDVYVFDDDFLLAADIHLAAAYDLESAEGRDALRERMEALPDTWSRPAMAPITRCSVMAVARACLADQGRDEIEIYERASELAGFDQEQAASVAKLLQAGFTADEIRHPYHGITEVSEGQMSAIMEAFGQAHFGDPGENSRADHEMAGLMQGRYMAEPDAPGDCYRILDNRDGVFDTQAMRTHVGAILYLDAIGDAKDGKIEVNDWLHEVDGDLAERPELADVYHMWDALCEGEAKRAFSGMSAEPLEGPTAFADLWQGDAAQAARPLQVISALRDMADRHESAPLICGAILAFADEGVECRQDHERALVRAIADNRANPYGERFGEPIEEASAAMRREVVPAIETEEGSAAGLGAFSEEKVAEAEQGTVVPEPVDHVR